MQLLQTYRDLCQQRGVVADPYQAEAARQLEEFATVRSGPQGVYLLGSVGRGKSMLMDLFFANPDVPSKRRVHFHALNRELRDGLAQTSGANPMTRVAARVAPAGSALCIDDLLLTDLDDAMLLEVFLAEVVDTRLVVISTSNNPDNDLLPDVIGLSRDDPESEARPGRLFLEGRVHTLSMLNENFQTLHLGGEVDHRFDREGSSRYFIDQEDTSEVLHRDFFLTHRRHALYVLTRWGRRWCLVCAPLTEAIQPRRSQPGCDLGLSGPDCLI
jgi:predicted ATPase